VNLPAIPAAEVKGVKLTRLGRRVFSDSIAKIKDPWGRPMFWIGGGSVKWTRDEGTDAAAVHAGYISVTPLHLDITHQARLDDADSWWKAP
jgi:5'-nucleotidase